MSDEGMHTKSPVVGDAQHGVYVCVENDGDPRVEKFQCAAFDVQPSGVLIVFDANGNEMIGRAWAQGRWRWAETYCDGAKPCLVCSRQS